MGSVFDNLTAKDIIGLPPMVILVVGVLWFLFKHGPGYMEGLKEQHKATVKFMEVTAPQAIQELGAVHDKSVSKIVTAVDQAKVEVKDHVTAHAVALREEIHDKRVDAIESKIERIAGRSSPDLSDSAPKSRKG